MSQDADAGETKEPKRFQHPAYVYGPLVYQFPSEQGGENEKVKTKFFQNVNMATVLIIALAVGGAILYVKGNRAEIGQLSLIGGASDQQILGPGGENQLPPRGQSRAWVASDSLYLREGPGTNYFATYLLPRNWGVSLTGDYQPDDRGEVWVRVTVETEQGRQDGWVSRRFLRF
ncbi:MAG TPA: SH3 domain-containing protein [Blastocatellia bacterium]|nr:SH3 domain-containing protein [Blastocatellia bacterium]